MPKQNWWFQWDTDKTVIARFNLAFSFLSKKLCQQKWFLTNELSEKKFGKFVSNVVLKFLLVLSLSKVNFWFNSVLALF